MCEWGNHTVCKVPIPSYISHTGKFRWDKKPIDSCLANIVNALNASGIYTSQCCCGHGKDNATINLHNGRIISIEFAKNPQNTKYTIEKAL